MSRRERLEALSAVVELEVVFLERCVECGALRLEDVPEQRPALEPAQLARLRRLERLCRGLEIDVYPGSIIVELLERVDGLERELDLLRGPSR